MHFICKSLPLHLGLYFFNPSLYKSRKIKSYVFIENTSLPVLYFKRQNFKYAEERPSEEVKTKTSGKLPLREATKVYISFSGIKPLSQQHA